MPELELGRLERHGTRARISVLHIFIISFTFPNVLRLHSSKTYSKENKF